ncbi:hypothetical protein [Tunturiibacter gelidiferens]|uniref:hypothetical protein n=1 Tax=Tunturiibacter gelidiferens TaxID=3069689 RepID=UPI003D9B9486
MLWPLAEAATANFTIAEVEVAPRTIPQPANRDLNSLLALIASSLFADVDAKASFWQRARGTQPAQALPQTPHLAEPPETASMLDAFRLAYTNLHEIWSLVLPPNSLLGLKNSPCSNRKTSACPTISGHASSTTSSSPTASAPSTAVTFSGRSPRSISHGLPLISP